ncbi:MAG: hypothetical protein CSA62_00650 [Planctomycetota bacterium]|nr:MAG: hypothetical protein CSA62_00650 [Planctomycetota bacterium]
MLKEHRQQIGTLGRFVPSAIRVHDFMQARPIVTIQIVANALHISFPTASSTLKKLAGLGIECEATGKQHGCIYVYSDDLALLGRGTEALPT